VTLFTFIFNENCNLIGLKGRGSFSDVYIGSNIFCTIRNRSVANSGFCSKLIGAEVLMIDDI